MYRQNSRKCTFNQLLCCSAFSFPAIIGQTGTYVNLTVGKRPEDLVFDLKKDASAAMWKTVRVMGKQPGEKAANLWADAENHYWEAVWWLDRAVLENKSSQRATAWGRSATSFTEVIARAENIQVLCGPHPTN